MESSSDAHIWDQMEGEDNVWYARFVQYLRMGTKRSINALYKKQTKKNQEKPSGNPYGDWYDTEKKWNWKERARAYDESVRAEEDRIIAEERDKILRSGFALQHKRIQTYDRLADRLIAYSRDESKVWLCETRTFKGGGDEEDVQIVEKVTFNAPLFAMIDKCLSAIAAEMGERVKKKDIAITELPPNVYLGFDPDQDGSVND